MKIYKFVMVVLSFALFIVSTILIMVHGIVGADDVVLEHRDLGYLIIICVFSLMAALLAAAFPHRLYKRTGDIDAIEARYRKAEMQLHQAAKMISDNLVKKLVDDIIDEIQLPSALEEKAKDIAKDFEDVEKTSDGRIKANKS